MGYLPNNTITVDAILTKKGRQILASGQQNFQITQFALADDEVDYNLWNPEHPSGSNYYGQAIEQMPVLEPVADETQSMRYKLVSLDKATVRIPVVTINTGNVSFQVGQSVTISPNTVQTAPQGTPLANLNSQLGYTAILHNSDAAFLNVVTAAPGTQAGGAYTNIENTIAQLNALIASLSAAGQNVSALQSMVNNLQSGANNLVTGAGTGIFLGDTGVAKSIFATGLVFQLVAKNVAPNNGNGGGSIVTTLTIIGNETGGSASITITTNPIAA